MALKTTPVYKNLHTRITILGLEMEDMIAVLILAIFMSFIGHFTNAGATFCGIPLDLFLEFVVPAIAVPMLMIFKYGRPRGYLQDWVGSLSSPRAWCALERDAVIKTPYIKDEL